MKSRLSPSNKSASSLKSLGRSLNRLPAHTESLKNSCFDIYGIGYSHSNKIYGNPNGIGFMITESIAMTANTVLQDEEVASRSFAKFSNGEVRKFSQKNFFYTNRGLNFTVIGVEFVANETIEIREEFVLVDRSRICYLDSGIVPCDIEGIDQNLFSYTGGSNILPGTPIFSQDWRLQGIHHTTSVSYKYNIGTRIDSIIKILCSVLRISSDDSASIGNSLGVLLTDYANKHHFKLKLVDKFGEGRYLYWIEWFNRHIYRYDVSLGKWSKIQLANSEQFLSQETNQWKFNWGSRLVYLPDGSFIAVGGVGFDLGGTRADVYQFFPDTLEIYRKKSMLERRDGPAILYRQNYIYVVGGKYTYTTCEKYDIKTDIWSRFSSMIYGRYEPVACLLQGDNYMYVAGGFPEESVGRSIERYSFSQDRWEGLNVVFPLPLLKCGIFPVTQTKFALLGGTSMKSVVIFEVNIEVIDGKTEEIFRVYEIEQLPDKIETVYPVVYYKNENKVYLTKTEDTKAPVVVYYSYRSFLKPSNETVFEFKKNLKLPPLFTKKNFLNEKFPQ
jgi:Kelch motif